MIHRRALVGVLLAVTVPSMAAAQGAQTAILYKNPQCQCCDAYAKVLQRNGIAVTVEETPALAALKREHGVPEPLQGCHTLLIDGYVVEAHVPVAAVKRLLAERPAIRGISLPGMPAGSPGMDGEKTAPFTVYEISDGAPKVFARE
ncbi:MULTISPECIES: DUF411 domain-containing protein [Methylobacterium]|jgi:hypothetical protein|uniref:Metal-binding protein n=2 Tax=Methylobacterium TaxID=407 RepID=A0A2R4WUJ8_9HYPH|nr:MULTISPECIES: DUF411 domain-containing protein [Methylobacterium]AWB25211.1 metal-binding protein [Methylobacterium currus]AWB25929.1 metal-binding protein [Methylobacterium currus]TGD95188.1 DUF411 domain-containing protein [Methylobacterium nonmethylotrophicum]SFF81867.1 Uncharacterized conserved protein [Methylobacterium sp. yr596]